MWQDAQASGGLTPSWRWCAAAAYLSDAWHCRQTPSPGRAKLGAVRLVAIAAGDAGREHLALLERAVVVDLVEHLPVGMIEPAAERRDRVRVRQPPARQPILGELRRGGRGTARRSRPPCAASAGAVAARGVAGLRIDRPGDVAPLVEADEQALCVGSSVLPNGHQLCRSRAQATCREPWPWQASQPTLISAKVVAKRSFAAS